MYRKTHTIYRVTIGGFRHPVGVLEHILHRWGNYCKAIIKKKKIVVTQLAEDRLQCKLGSNLKVHVISATPTLPKGQD